MLNLINKIGYFLRGCYNNAYYDYENPNQTMSAYEVQSNYEMSVMLEKLMNYMQNSLSVRFEKSLANKEKLMKLLNEYVDKMEKQVDLRNPNVPKQQGKKQLSEFEFDAKKEAIKRIRELIAEGISRA